MRRALLLSVLAFTSLGLSACKAELSSTLQIDGEAFTPTSCRSGQLNNFMGVDLIDDSGKTLRLVQSPANKPAAILMEGGATTELGECGQFTVQRQNSSVNDVHNVEGSGTLECKAEGHEITGNFTFKNCH